MNDVYIRDTRKAITDAQEAVGELDGILDKSFIEIFNTLITESDGLCDHSESKFEALESAEDALKENGIEV